MVTDNMIGSLRRGWRGVKCGFRSRRGVRESNGSTGNMGKTVEKWDGSDSPEGVVVSDADQGVNKTVSLWDKSDEVYEIDGFKVYWELLEEVRDYQNQMMTNGKDEREYYAPFFPEDKELSDLTGLIIGCNYGENSPVVAMAKTTAFGKLIVVDIAKGLLERQAQITNRMGLNHKIEYRCMDLNTESLREKTRYDFIYSLGTIHHLETLERLFSEINDILRKDGIFYMREYVGPSYIQFTDTQVGIVNRILAGLPEHLKKDRLGNIKNKAWRPSIEEVRAGDPSEAVRSQDIMGVVREKLDILTCNMTGGTILAPLLHGIAGNFERADAERAVLKCLIVLEQVLIEAGVIPSDYVSLIARSTP